MTRRVNGGLIGITNTPTSGSASGVWSLFEQGLAKKASAWPAASTVPGAPTSVSATAGNGQATVSFTAPASTGGMPITSYTVTSSPGGFTASGASSPIVVTGLTNGTAYTFTVVATNVVGSGTASAASNSVSPNAGPTSIELMAVAGGGGGGDGIGGGGGAGGLLYYGAETPKTPNGASVSVSAGTTYVVTIGAGGNGGGNDSSPPPAPGTDTKFQVSGGSILVQAYGGGYGGSQSTSGGNGGCGGGAGGKNAEPPGGTGVSGQGFQGGV